MSERGSDERTRERVGAFVFWTGAALAVPLLMYFGRDFWFKNDDWHFLADRSASSLSDILRPHASHWTTLPMLQWRLFYRLFGLHYEPYLLAVVLSHIAIAAALRQVMRRSHVPVVVATAIPLAFIFFGSGWQEVIDPFQTTFNGSVLFGLVHLLLADTTEPSRRRDLLGLLAGAAALMCSGIGVAMVFAVGLAVLLSRGWRAALLHTVPLAVLQGAWWLGYGRADGRTPPPASKLVDSTELGFRNVFDQIAQLPGLGFVLLLSTILAVAYAWMTMSSESDRARLAGPTGLLGGSLVMFASVAFGRADGLLGIQITTASRFVYIGAALVIPAVGLAIAVLASRAWVLGAVPLLLVAIGMPGNVRELTGLELGLPEGAVRAVPEVSFASEVSPSPSSYLFGDRHLTLGFLSSAAEDGRFAEVEPSPRDLAIAEFALVLQQQDGEAPKNCPPLTNRVTATFNPGDVISFTRDLQVAEVDAGHDYVLRFNANRGGGNQLVVYARPVTVELWSSIPLLPAEICLPSS